jgi:ribosomal protein S11
MDSLKVINIDNKQDLNGLNKKYDFVVVTVNYSPSNVIASVCDCLGHVLYQESSGSCGYKSSEKDSYVSNNHLGMKVAKFVATRNPGKDVVFRIIGNSFNKRIFLKALTDVLENKGVIKGVFENSPIPFNGCRKCKRRRKRGSHR